MKYLLTLEGNKKLIVHIVSFTAYTPRAKFPSLGGCTVPKKMREIIDNTYSLVKLTAPCSCGTTWEYPEIQGITYYPKKRCDKCKTQYFYACEGDAKRYRLQPETVALWNDIIEILSNYDEPIGVRQLFYQLVKI